MLNLVCDNAENKTTAENAGVLEVVVATMLAHIDHQSVHGEACGVLRNLLNATQEFKEKAKNAGAVQALIAAMHRHQQFTALQERACGLCID